MGLLWTGIVIRMSPQVSWLTPRLGGVPPQPLVVRVPMGQLSSRPRSPKRSSDLGSPTELLDRGDILFCHPRVDILSGLECNEMKLDKRERGEKGRIDSVDLWRFMSRCGDRCLTRLTGEEGAGRVDLAAPVLLSQDLLDCERVS